MQRSTLRRLITVKVDQLSESQIAEIALAVQNRWDIPAFVKMHEIIIIDDEQIDDNPREITQALDLESFQRGLLTILENLELMDAFSLEREGKSDFKLRLVDMSKIPKWVTDIQNKRVPEGVFECPHCGKWYNSEFELNLHTKLHYIL